MPRKWSKAVPEGNDLAPHHDEFGSREPTLADTYRMFEEWFDRMDKNLDRMSELTGMLRATNKFSRPGTRSSAATSRHGGRRRT